jgi:hypothetical protein
MRKLPQIGPLIVPTVLDTLFANLGHWFSGLLRIAVLVLIILVPISLANSRRVDDMSASGPSSSSKYLSLESSPFAVPAGQARAGEKQAVDSAAGPTSGSVPNSVDAATRGPRND